MKNNNKNDTWINLLLFFLITDKPETLLDLIQSDNCEEEFTDIVQRIVTMDSKWFQYTCIEWLMNHKDKLFELNKAYKTSQKEFEIVTQDEVKDIEQNFIEKDVLDKIRTEIEQNAYPIVYGINNHEKGMTLYGILQIIDKYKESKNE